MAMARAVVCNALCHDSPAVQSTCLDPPKEPAMLSILTFQPMKHRIILGLAIILVVPALALPVRAETPLRQVIDTEVKAVCTQL